MLSVFGTPSPLLYGVRRIVERLAHFSEKRTAVLAADNLNILREKWGELDRSEIKRVFFFSECPSRDLVQLMANVGTPALLVIENFASIVRFAMTQHHMDFRFAARFATHVLCAASPVGELPSVLRVSEADEHRELSLFVERVARFSETAITRENFGALIAELSGAEGGRSTMTLGDYLAAHFPSDRDLAAFRAALNVEDSRTLTTLETSYGRLAEGRELEDAIWPNACFLTEGEQAFTGAVECVGPARVLFFGPYLFLPRGQWRAQIELEIAECYSDNRLAAEVVLFPDEIVRAVKTELPVAGRFRLDLEFTTPDDLRPIEMRVHLATGAIEGRLRFGPLRLTRLLS